MYCKKCGAIIDEVTGSCPKCEPVQQTVQENYAQQPSQPQSPIINYVDDAVRNKTGYANTATYLSDSKPMKKLNFAGIGMGAICAVIAFFASGNFLVALAIGAVVGLCLYIMIIGAVSAVLLARSGKQVYRVEKTIDAGELCSFLASRLSVFEFTGWKIGNPAPFGAKSMADTEVVRIQFTFREQTVHGIDFPSADFSSYKIKSAGTTRKHVLKTGSRNYLLPYKNDCLVRPVIEAVIEEYQRLK